MRRRILSAESLIALDRDWLVWRRLASFILSSQCPLCETRSARKPFTSNRHDIDQPKAVKRRSASHTRKEPGWNEQTGCRLHDLNPRSSYSYSSINLMGEE